MDVTCPACAARYTADDDKLRGKTARMRCKACNTAWLVSGPDAGPAVGSAITTPPPASVVALPQATKAAADEPKRAAVVKRGAEREKRDLFATREPELGEVKQTMLPPPSFGFTAGVRNEDSVLFRVDQLPGAARLKTPPPASAPKVDTDDGVIDLKALAETPPALRPVAAPVAPLFSEPPPVTMEVDAKRAKPVSKLRLIGGLAAAAIALVGIGVGVAYAFKGEEPVSHTPITATAPPEVAPPPATETADPAPSAVASNDADEDRDVKPVKGKRGKRGRGAKGRSGPITNKTPPPAQKKVKPADPCGCKGDFNCILACTARGGK